MNISFALNNLSLYSPTSFGGGYPASSASGKAQFSGQTGMSNVQMPEQAGASGQVEMPGQTAPQNATGNRPVPGQQDLDSYECQTCKNRKYQDGSDEDVSFKAPSHIDPSAAASRVRSHEQEHVNNAYKKASEDNGKVVSCNVSLRTSVCPECGRTYVSGGTTKTQIKYYNEDNPYQKEMKSSDAAGKYRGMNLDAAF